MKYCLIYQIPGNRIERCPAVKTIRQRTTLKHVLSFCYKVKDDGTPIWIHNEVLYDRAMFDIRFVKMYQTLLSNTINHIHTNQLKECLLFGIFFKEKQ